MALKFGIMQGRLTMSRKNILNKFPRNWQKEFYYLKKTDLDYIEFFTEQKFNKRNPIWSNNGISKIQKKLSSTNFKKLILCDNYTIKNPLLSNKTEKYLINLINQISFFKSSKLIIPIVSKNLNSNKIFKDHTIFIRNFLDYSKKKKIELSFEIDAKFKIVKKFCKEFKKNKNFSITLDTGNAYLFNKNFYDEIKNIKSSINHVHLKDRNSLGENVVLGTGDINFDLFFKNLNSKKNYDKTITFETNRGKMPIKTAKINLDIIKNYLY